MHAGLRSGTATNEHFDNSRRASANPAMQKRSPSPAKHQRVNDIIFGIKLFGSFLRLIGHEFVSYTVHVCEQTRVARCIEFFPQPFYIDPDSIRRDL